MLQSSLASLDLLDNRDGVAKLRRSISTLVSCALVRFITFSTCLLGLDATDRASATVAIKFDNEGGISEVIHRMRKNQIDS